MKEQYDEIWITLLYFLQPVFETLPVESIKQPTIAPKAKANGIASNLKTNSLKSEHYKLVMHLAESLQSESPKTSDCITATTVSVHTDEDTQIPFYHLTILAKGHHLSVMDYQSKIGDFSWHITTQHSKSSTRFSKLYQRLIAENGHHSASKRLPKHVVLIQPQNLGDDAFQLSCEKESDDKTTATYRYRSIGVVLKSSDTAAIITFSLMQDHSNDASQVLDSVRGKLAPVEVSSDSYPIHWLYVFA